MWVKAHSVHLQEILGKLEEIDAMSWMMHACVSCTQQESFRYALYQRHVCQSDASDGMKSQAGIRD